MKKKKGHIILWIKLGWKFRKKNIVDTKNQYQKAGFSIAVKNLFLDLQFSLFS